MPLPPAPPAPPRPAPPAPPPPAPAATPLAGFRTGTRTKAKLRLAIAGPAGSGKTFTTLRLAHCMVALGVPGPIAVINSETGAVDKYVGEAPDGQPWAFDVADIAGDFGPQRYIQLLDLAVEMVYGVIVVDGLSPAWTGPGGVLDIVDRAGGSKFSSGWKTASPQHARLVDTMLALPAHLLVTLRTKTEYVIEEDARGKAVPRKVGTKPVQRDDIDFEFDVYAEMDVAHTLTVTKTRCSAVDGRVITKPGMELARPLVAWLNDGG